MVLIVIGVLLVALAPAWLWGIGPLFVKMPADLKIDSTYRGTLTVYADRVTTRFYPAGEEVVTPLTIQARDHSVASKNTSSLLVMDERVDVRDASTGQALPGVRPNATYVLDRRTCQNVPGIIEGVDRTGYSLTFPIGAAKKDYPMWDDELGHSTSCKYERSTRMDGDKYKGVTVYVYSIPPEMEKMVKPPPGLPETLSGAQLKQMSPGSSLPVPDTFQIKLEYYKKIELTQYVEPRTGVVVYVPKNHYEYYVKNAPGQSPAYLKLASVEYRRVLDNARGEIDASAKYFWPLDLDLKWTPLSYLITGLILLACGVFLMVRSSRKAKPEGERPAE